ncbi:MAG: c-type cytochrome biogenesis protein CcmI [Gammaproteobacteria bacterium]|nr:c-type cytochrome biogenesis protein CcmI [Gammaproteobacteria bacterium]MBU1600750.1 c-type cytochrome biogenesis protein CcmI [Gammaproteobacteria bacterium]MBU2435206.1 c-type cytochrome biogenesis protein CcmI [Gammaproteobacteria bacterium]MBU2448620.1 c-type cytochrome biogenesis protein CcmI [Gammaproteobacteria bacterium]
MNLFAVFAVLLIVVVSAFILPPLWLGLRAPKSQADRKEANVAIFRDQLAELVREKSDGSLAEADFEQARHELQRRLLEEVEPADAALAAKATHGPSRKTAMVILVLLPIFGLLGYGILGNPTALDPVQTAAPQEMTPEKINEMVTGLAEKLKADPDNIPGWLMLARSYKSMGRYAEAVDAYSHAEKGIGDDPDQLASYAETIAMANGKGITGKAIQLIEQALKINPNHGHSLFLAGAAAMEAGQNKKGIAYWEALLPQVEPGSEIDQMLQSGLAKMRAAK